MRVVFIGGWFHGEGDDCHLRKVAEMVELTVYGHHVTAPDGLPEPAPRPDLCDFCPSRELTPVHVSVGVGPRLWFYRHLGQALDEDRPDVVHVLTEPWQLLALQASAWARRRPET